MGHRNSHLVSAGVGSYDNGNQNGNNMKTNSSNYINNNNNSSSSSSSRPYSKAADKKKKRRTPKQLTNNELERITHEVVDLVHHWFPRMHRQTYFLPPVHMNKVRQEGRRLAGTEVQEIQATPESDWRDDEVMQRTLLCLRALTHTLQEGMVVLLQMQHDNYLNKSCYAPAAALYPRPGDLDTSLQRGDFDVLFLHGQRGIIVAEVKSVGWRAGGEQDAAVVSRKVAQAVQQLNKARAVLTHLVGDLHPAPSITPTLVLPNVTYLRLRHLLAADQHLAEEFCRCFHTADVTSALSLCLCADQMTTRSAPADVSDAILQQLERWWRSVGAGGGYSSAGTGGGYPSADAREEVYELLVARFCGPASTVQVHCTKAPRLEFRTLGHAVQEVGERMVQFNLFPPQLALLQEDDDCVFLTGPPGTGKTLLLALVAVKWSRQGRHVHIVSTGTFSEAATHLLYYMVTQTLIGEGDEGAAKRIHLHLNNNSSQNTPAILSNLIAAAAAAEEDAEADGVGDAASSGAEVTPGDLTETQGEGAAAGYIRSNVAASAQGTQPAGTGSRQGRQLHVVADELGEKFSEFFEELSNNVAELKLWAASYRTEFRPPAMTEKVLSACLRSTPTVQRRMETAVSFSNGVLGYDDNRSEYLSPSEGPEEIFLSHVHHADSARVPAMDCLHCGIDIANCLVEQLRVGQTPTRPPPKGVKTPPPLRYSDVMVMPDFYQNIKDLHDDEEDNVDDAEEKENDVNDDDATNDVTTTTTVTLNNQLPPRHHNSRRRRPAKATGTATATTTTTTTGTGTATAIVRGLRSRGVPAYVVTRHDGEAVRQLARASRDEVAVVEWGVSNGLERKVVVSVGRGRGIGSNGRVSGVLQGASRCVSQLVYVTCPEE